VIPAVKWGRLRFQVAVARASREVENGGDGEVKEREYCLRCVVVFGTGGRMGSEVVGFRPANERLPISAAACLVQTDDLVPESHPETSQENRGSCNRNVCLFFSGESDSLQLE
jgi:hypothetical protein